MSAWTGDPVVDAVIESYHQKIQEEHDFQADGKRFADRDARFLAVGHETGKLLNILARSLEKPRILEIGTSYGYSGLWLADAARAAGGKVITLELHDYKSAHARAQAEKAGLADWIDFRVGDAVQLIAELPGPFDLVLLDLWKDMYIPCLEAFYPKLSPGAIVVADNMLFPESARADAGRYGVAVRKKPGIASVLLPVGSGLEVSRLEG